jgi:peptide/nickel transport system ATP-binding protein
LLTKPDTDPSGEPPAAPTGEPLVEAAGLEVHFGLRGGLLGRLGGRDAGAVRAVDGVDLTLRKGEVLGLVGESGSGKTTLGRTLIGLTPATAGSVRYRGQDITGLGERRLRPLRRHLQMVFQDPHASLNPAMDIRTAVGHPLRIHGLVSTDAEYEAKVVDALERVGLTPPERFLGKFPGDLSGGQKQRAVLARAIIAEPELLVADEPISMLDMSVRAKILQLMLDLKRDLDLTYVYVTHDLASAKFFCDTIAIMYLGRIVEYGPAAEVFAHPQHPYTEALLAAIPEPDPERAVPRELPRGEIPDAAQPPLGCSFHPRCPVAVAGCGWEARDLRALLDNRWLELAPEVSAREKALFADLDALAQPGLSSIAIAPGRGHGPEDVLDFLARLRDEDAAGPDGPADAAEGEAPEAGPEAHARHGEPFWRGVVAMHTEGGRAVVEFAPPREPRLLPLLTGDVRVACHLREAATSGSGA